MRCASRLSSAHATAVPLRAAATAFMFPGQGAQAVGMGQDLALRFPAARAAFDEVDEALGEALSATLFAGPAVALGRTANTQPALLAHGIAALRSVIDDHGRGSSASCITVLGHSVGEYAALVAAGALELADAARLLRARGLLMEAAAAAAANEAAPDGGDPHCMVALLLRPLSSRRRAEAGDVTATANAAAPTAHLDAAIAAAQRACDAAVAASGRPGAFASIAAVNSPRQIVLSGSTEAVGAAATELVHAGVAARSVRLAVTVPFHSTAMQPAGAALATLIAGAAVEPLSPAAERLLGSIASVTDCSAASYWPVRIRAPAIPLISNVSATPESDPTRIAHLLCEGVTQPVRWRDCVRASAILGVSSFVEFGPGATLSGLVEQCSVGEGLGTLTARNVATAQDVDALSLVLA